MFKPNPNSRLFPAETKTVLERLEGVLRRVNAYKAINWYDKYTVKGFADQNQYDQANDLASFEQFEDDYYNCRDLMEENEKKMAKLIKILDAFARGKFGRLGEFEKNAFLLLKPADIEHQDIDGKTLGEICDEVKVYYQLAQLALKLQKRALRAGDEVKEKLGVQLVRVKLLMEWDEPMKLFLKSVGYIKALNHHLLVWGK